MEEKLTLLELQEKIKRGIEGAVPGAVWVTAEIGELNNHYSGHCYMDLIDYKEGSRGVAAKARGVIWSWDLSPTRVQTSVQIQSGLIS